MKHGIQKKLAEKVGLSAAALSMIINGKRGTTWKTAQKLAEETGTEETLWLRGDVQQIKKSLANFSL